MTNISRVQLKDSKPVVDVLILLMSLVAEGTPQLALQLAQEWKSKGLSVAVLVMLHEPLDMQKDFEKIGIPLYFLSLGSGLARYWRLSNEIFKFCSKHRVRSLMSFPLGWHSFAALGARITGTKKVCAYVGNPPPIWTGMAFYKFLFMLQIGRAFTHKLVCCSNYLYKLTLRDFKVFPWEATVIYNSCDLDSFALLEPSSRSPNLPPRIAMTARLEVHKDQPTLIKAAALLKKQGTPVEVWLIGEGSRRSEYETLIHQLDVVDEVKLLGSRRDVASLLNQCDLFVFQALRDEGFGIALAEAMAARVPIVATDVGACIEVLDAGRCGLLVQEQNPQATVHGILEVLNNPHQSEIRVQAAYSRAINYFSVPESAISYGRALGII